MLVIHLDATREAIVEHGKVESQVGGSGFFPTQGVVRRILNICSKVFAPWVVLRRFDGNVGAGATWYVSTDTIGEAQGEVVEP